MKLTNSQSIAAFYLVIKNKYKKIKTKLFLNPQFCFISNKLVKPETSILKQIKPSFGEIVDLFLKENSDIDLSKHMSLTIQTGHEKLGNLKIKTYKTPRVSKELSKKFSTFHDKYINLVLIDNQVAKEVESVKTITFQ
jgi:hypothetical protein